MARLRPKFIAFALAPVGRFMIKNTSTIAPMVRKVGNKVVKNLIIEKLTTPSGKDFASAIWSDLQDGANIEIDNRKIKITLY